MSSTEESLTPPCTRGRKRRCTDAAQTEAEMKKRQRTTSQLRKIQGALLNSSMVTLIGPNDALPSSKNPQKIKVEEEADVDVKPEEGGDEMPNDKEWECSRTAAVTVSQNQVGGEVGVPAEVHIAMDSGVDAQVLETPSPEETTCVQCQDLKKLSAEKDLKIKELEEQLALLKQKHHHDITVSKLIAEVDAEDKEDDVTLGGERKEKDKPIFLAILEGKSKAEIQSLVESGEEWDVPNADGDTVLHLASKAGSSELLKYFISISDQPDVNAKNSSGSTPLMEAAKSDKNFRQVFGVLVKKGADLEAKDLEGNSVLHIAIAAGRSEKEIEKIIKSTPNWNFRTSGGNTVLHAATKSGNLEALQYFLSLGLDVNARNEMDETPLMTATSANQNFLVMVHLLLKNRADITLRNKSGEDVICYAIKNRRTCEEIVFLTTADETWNLKTRWADKKTILHLCAEHGHVKAMEHFIGKGAGINAVDDDDVTPVMDAARWGMCEAMNLLIEKGAKFEATKLLDEVLSILLEINLENIGEIVELFETMKSLLEHGAILDDDNRVTAFHSFVQYGVLDAVRYLILNGVDVNATDSQGDTPLMTAIAESTTEQQLKVFDLLIQNGADINEVNGEGFNLLHLATYWGWSLEILEKLIQHGATWSNTVTGKEPHQESILHAAVHGGHPDVVKFFITKGVDIKARDTMGDTPFLCAMKLGSKSNFGKIMQVLVNGGADPNEIDDEGNTALLAGTKDMCEGEDSWIGLPHLKLLVALGCDSRISNKKGETVLSVLKDHGKFHLLKYFKSSA